MKSVEQQGEKVLPSSVDSDTGGRIKQLLEHYGLSTYQANQKLGYTKSSKLYKVLSNEVRPGYDTLMEIITAFPDVSPGWLLTGKGPMLSTIAEAPVIGAPAVKVLAQQVRPAHSVSGIDRVLTVTVDKDGDENTSLVTVPAQAGYARHHNEAVFMQNLRHYRIPGFEGGTYRAFEVSGDSMEPTINHRDVVVASVVDRWDLLTPGDIYVVVTSESVFLKRIRERVTDMNGLVELYSDNYHVKPYSLPAIDITQLWRVRGYVSTYIPSKPDVTMERLWEVIELLGHDRGEVRRYLAEDAPR